MSSASDPIVGVMLVCGYLISTIGAFMVFGPGGAMVMMGLELFVGALVLEALWKRK